MYWLILKLEVITVGDSLRSKKLHCYSVVSEVCSSKRLRCRVMNCVIWNLYRWLNNDTFFCRSMRCGIQHYLCSTCGHFLRMSVLYQDQIYASSSTENMLRYVFLNTLLSGDTRRCTWKSISRQICDHGKLMTCRRERETRHLSCQGALSWAVISRFPPRCTLRRLGYDWCRKDLSILCLTSKANTSWPADLFASAPGCLRNSFGEPIRLTRFNLREWGETKWMARAHHRRKGYCRVCIFPRRKEGMYSTVEGLTTVRRKITSCDQIAVTETGTLTYWTYVHLMNMPHASSVFVYAQKK